MSMQDKSDMSSQHRGPRDATSGIGSGDRQRTGSDVPMNKPHAAKRTREDAPLPVAEPEGPTAGPGRKITAFERDSRHEDEWSRTPNTTGVGAIHVKTFHAKLTDDALRYMDQCINEWLDAHPQYEVKFVNSTVGDLTGKTKEPHLICQVWV